MKFAFFAEKCISLLAKFNIFGNKILWSLKMHQIALCMSKVMLNVILADAVCLHLIKEISVSLHNMQENFGTVI